MKPDAFEDLSHYYDTLMSHVGYDRWFMVTTCLAEVLPPEFQHLDAACGTGVFAKQLLKAGWNSIGMDLSPAMLRIARKTPPRPVAVVADLCAMPFAQRFGMITCLFDSMNFLLRIDDVRGAIRHCGDALVDGGILYFDVVTERMVTEHFEGQEWVEDNATFSSRWRSTYDRKTCITETRIRVNRGQESVVRERIYPIEEIRDAVERAGLTLLDVCDARTWRAPTARTIRVDVVAARNPGSVEHKRFRAVRAGIRGRLKDMNY